jgi:tetratricopeptide (TPR) repeat protein
MTDHKENNRRGNLAARELFQAAQHLFKEGRYRECIDVFTEFMDLRGEVEIALLSRGVAYLKAEQIDMAIEDFGKVIHMSSDNVRAYFYRGMALLAIKDFESAIKDFDRTIELKPDHGAAFFARGSAYAQIGNEYEATRNIKTAITFSEADIEGVSDSLGLFRSQFDKAMAILTDQDKAPGMTLSAGEITLVKKWIEGRDQ